MQDSLGLTVQAAKGNDQSESHTRQGTSRGGSTPPSGSCSVPSKANLAEVVGAPRKRNPRPRQGYVGLAEDGEYAIAQQIALGHRQEKGPREGVAVEMSRKSGRPRRLAENLKVEHKSHANRVRD